MKRSQLNALIADALRLAEQRGLELPPFARWGPEDWRRLDGRSAEIVDNMLGWDITDFGSGDYERTGLLIFTFRNGNLNKPRQYPKPYAEKMLLVKDGQELPFHFHWSKMEDIVNRGGGNLEMQVYNADPREGFAGSDVILSIDGARTAVKAGGEIALSPGQSVTLLPGQYHRWVGRADKPGGTVVLFEVSTVNDDRTDNRFYSAGDRIPRVEEDEPARYLLFRDYPAYAGLG